MEIRTGNVSRLLKGVTIPKFFHVKQNFPETYQAITDIPQKVHIEMMKPVITSRIKHGMNIAITVGSRGIANRSIIVKAIVDEVKAKGASPFIVPAMGCHGGGNAEGQKALLAGYGITEETMECPINPSMDVDYLGMTKYDRPVYIGKAAHEADGIIIFCNIKPHSSFHGKYESGPCKTLAVGLGKQEGADSLHSDGVEGIARNIPAMAKVILARSPVLFALASIENAYGETCLFEAVPSECILRREPDLLKIAKVNMPSILTGNPNVLIVDEIGKNFGCIGVDTNVIGTHPDKVVRGEEDRQRTCFLNLSRESQGNALGVGFASAITKKVFDAMDLEATYPNCVTSRLLSFARIPVVTMNDEEAIKLCIRTSIGIDRANTRVVRIPNSQNMDCIMLSEAYYGDVILGRIPGIVALDKPAALVFESGELVTPCHI